MLAKWCQTTSCNGIINLYEARKNKPLFIFWAILMFSMTVASIFFTYKTIKGYVDSPYATNIATIPKAEFLLPDIAICYNGAVNVSAMKEVNFSDDFIILFMQYLMETPFEIKTNLTIDEARVQLLTYMDEKEISRRNIYDHFMFTCEDLIQGICQNYSKSISSGSGRCFTYENYFSQKHPMEGISFELYSPRTSFANSYVKESYEMEINKDFSIVIEKSIDSISLDRYYNIPINCNAEIVLYPQFYKRIFDGQCEPNATAKPTSTSCFSRCWAEEYGNACQCTTLGYFGVDRINDTEICLPFHICDQIDDAKAEKCKSKCLQKCEQWIYDPMITCSPIDSKIAADYSHVHIHYGDLQYLKIEEIESFTFDMAIANVGGQCGLWLGASIVTLIEVLYYLVLMLTNKLTVNSARNKGAELKTDHAICEKMFKEQNRVIQLLADKIKSFEEKLKRLDETKTDQASCKEMINEQNRVVQLLADEFKSMKETHKRI